MYFTREPIIETIISPREGYQLILRKSKQSSDEEYCVDSVEVITFGNHSFYRSLDRSETFLLPVSDYEICEGRRARLGLKTKGTVEKEIKIGKSRESKGEEKKKRPSRKKKEKKVEVVAEEPKTFPDEEELEVVAPRELIPPPSSLISDTISRYQIEPEDEGSLDEEQEIDLSVEEENNELPSGS